ncbi:MAG: helix-turn-helix domain-containing protein [Acidimicrobiales bacterium]|nr:helix-turn-helix domain-containing protein [Acidimicrobiales bacterium]
MPLENAGHNAPAERCRWRAIDVRLPSTVGRNHQENVIAATSRPGHDDGVSTDSAPSLDPPLRRIVLVAFDGMQLLDLAGPLEVFDAANRLGANPAYDVVVATRGGGPVRTSSGIDVGGQVGVEELAADPALGIHSLMVTGGNGTRALISDEPFLDQIRVLAGGAERVTSVCTGALVLAAAGLLDGRRATTHWAACDLLGTFAAVTVEPDRIYVRDGDRWTSAGVTAGIDLALALVDADHGPELAHQVASYLVVFARRPGGQAQFSASLRAQPARSSSLAELQRWLPDHLGDDLTVERLAERAAMSPRTFARAFRAETGMTPAAHVEELRVEAARRLLETSDLTVGEIARRVGLTRAETLHRAFARRTGTTPAAYRDHFARRTA